VHSKQFTTVGALTAAAMQGMKAAGLYTGGRVRYGYALATDGVTVTPCESEQATIAEARRLHAAGLSQLKIAAALADRGLLNRKGRPFSAGSVQCILEATP
jgi:hypothetical protein